MKRVQFPHDVFCTQTWSPSHCFVHKYGRRYVMWKRSIGRCGLSCAHTWFCFFTSGEKTLGISSVLILKIKSFKYHDKTSCRSVRSVIILVNKQIELALRGRPIFLITRVITDQTGFHSVLWIVLKWRHGGYIGVRNDLLHEIRASTDMLLVKEDLT